MSELFPAFPVEDTQDTPDIFGEERAASAAYKVLARKYRPAKFAELIGQDVVVRTLTNAIKTGRLAQAWMMTGVRGVGKTTTARIIARALNCLGADGQATAPMPEPCGVCANCVAIAGDRHVDVLEMDAASRTGVDDIREIIDGVRYNPVNARYKIYIIDEVHMLSKHAFNALLKTLEEPPPHVKFIFATTEIRKVPVTVLSRCQRFDLRRVDAAVLAQHFAHVASMEGAAVAPEALALIARAADGSVRDGLSLLDQAIARADGLVDAEAVQAMLGLADRAGVMDMARDIMLGAMREGLAAYDALLGGGTDPLVLLQDMAEFTHLLTRAKLVPEIVKGEALPEAEKKFIASLGAVEIPALTRAWQILLKGIQEVQTAHNPAQAAEMVLIRLAYAANLPPPADLARKLQSESGQGSGGSTASPSGQGSGGGAPMATRGNLALAVENAAPVAVAAPVVQAAPQPALLPMPEDFRALVALFKMQGELKTYGELYQCAHPVRMEPGSLEIFLEPHAAPDLAARVGKSLSGWTGQRWMVSLARAGDAPTLAQEEQARLQAERNAVINHPLVQCALELFPGAKLVNIRPPPAAAPVVKEAAIGDDEASDPVEPFDPVEE